MTTIFVDLPNYSPNSNGILCLYELCLHLHESGFAVYGVPRNLRSFMQEIKRLPVRFKEIPIADKPFGSSSDFFIVAETASSKTVARARKQHMSIVWWALAPYRLLDGSQMPKVGDISLPFSSYIDPGSERFFYFQPELDSHFRDALINQKPRGGLRKPRVCLYNGKGRLRKIPSEVLDLCKNAEIILITRNAPQTRAQLFSLLGSVDCMITFDELSAINLEAAALGVPVFLANPLFPPVCRQRFSVAKLKELVVSDVSEFRELVSMRRRNLIKSWNPADLTKLNQATLDSWRELLRAPDKYMHYKVSPISVKRFRSFSQFLKRARVISVHNSGQAGGAWLLPRYASAVSLGVNSPWLMRAVKLLDYIYILCSPALLWLERLPLAKKVLRKKYSSKFLYSCIGGVKTYDLR